MWYQYQYWYQFLDLLLCPKFWYIFILYISKIISRASMALVNAIFNTTYIFSVKLYKLARNLTFILSFSCFSLSSDYHLYTFPYGVNHKYAIFSQTNSMTIVAHHSLNKFLLSFANKLIWLAYAWLLFLGWLLDILNYKLVYNFLTEIMFYCLHMFRKK